MASWSTARRKTTLVLFLAVLCPAIGLAEEKGPVVESVRFRASVTARAFVVPKRLEEHEPVFRASLENMPEALVVVGALVVGGKELGLSPKQAGSLTPLISDAYAKIGADPAFRKTPSALPYCFATTRPTEGHYFLYRPAKMPDNPRCIVFLHGYGGNFQFYTWVLKEEFPEAVILAPSWGANWLDGSATYLKEMLDDARRRTGLELGRPWLMAISGGGPAGFAIYNQVPDAFAGYVSIASLPGTSTARRLSPNLKILMLNGTTDAMVPIAVARKQAELARQALPTLETKEIEGDHFFLLSKRPETFAAVRKFVKDP